jgi:hypothetical protein
VKSTEKRIRQLELLHLPPKPGPPYLWEDFLLLCALSRNVPRIWPDPDAMPKFLRAACRDLGIAPYLKSESPND